MVGMLMCRAENSSARTLMVRQLVDGQEHLSLFLLMEKL